MSEVGLSDLKEQKLSIRLEIDTRPPVEPNLALRQNALDQTEGVGTVEGKRWAHHLLERIESLQ